MSLDNPTSKGSQESSVDLPLGLFADAYSGKTSTKVSTKNTVDTESSILQAIKDNPTAAAATAAMALGANNNMEFLLSKDYPYSFDGEFEMLV
ncbi:hypothetical protein BH11CYA1_BH11CYA1_35250 [soil metagenome]